MTSAQRGRESGPTWRLFIAWLGLVVSEAYHSVMDLQFTAVFRQVPEGYIGFVEELPGANTQGTTLDEARANLQEAVAMVLEANRKLAQKAAGEGPVIREPLKEESEESGGDLWSRAAGQHGLERFFLRSQPDPSVARVKAGRL